MSDKTNPYFRDRVRTIQDERERIIALSDFNLDLPNVGIFDEPTRCYKVNKEWAKIVTGAVSILLEIGVWKNADHEDYEGIRQISDFLNGEDCVGQLSEEGDCLNYPPYAPFVSYSPINPYTDPDEIPTDWLAPPFEIYDGGGSLPPAYLAGDIIVPFAAMTLNPFDIFGGNLPTIQIQVVGSGQIELDLLAIPLGGLCAVSLNGSPSIIDVLNGSFSPDTVVIDTNLDNASLPFEDDVSVQHEINIVAGEGVTTTVFLTFMPVIDDQLFSPLRFGGGLRLIGLCGFENSGVIMGITDIRMNNCVLEYFLDGAWFPANGFDPACFTGPQGATGLQGIQGLTGATGLQGIQGVAGQDGADGIDGTNGLDGSDGEQGIQGVAGANGLDGAQGIQGIQGIQGVAGQDGADGVGGLSYVMDKRTHNLATAFSGSTGNWSNVDPDYGITSVLLGGGMTWVSMSVICRVAASENSNQGFFRIEANGQFSEQIGMISKDGSSFNEIIIVGLFDGLPSGSTVFNLQWKSTNDNVFIGKGIFTANLFELAANVETWLVTFDAGDDAYTLSTNNAGTVQSGGNPDDCLKATNTSGNDIVGIEIDLGSPRLIDNIEFGAFTSDILHTNFAVWIDGTIEGFGDIPVVASWNDINSATDGTFSPDYPLTAQFLKINLNPHSAASIADLRLDNVKITYS